MDTAAAMTLLALIVALAGVSQALHVQDSLDKNDILPGSSEENVADRLLRLVRQQTTHKLKGFHFFLFQFHSLSYYLEQGS